MSSKVKVCIIGAESWGSAIATAVGDNVLQSKKFDQRLLMYVYDEHVGDNTLSDIINDTHENIKYLPGIPLPTNLVAVGDLLKTAQNADIIIFATPQHFIKPYCNLLAGKIKQSAIAVSLVKGFERINDGEIHLFSQAISRQLAIPCYTLVSANCAMEMAQGKICEVTIGCDNPVHAELLKDTFQTRNCKVVAIDDVKGVELVGALKDIIALGAGLADGLRLGDNARVAVLHLGLKEMMRFVKGFYPTTKLSTFFEGCGVADLVASCYADKNVQFAKAFVTSGKTIQELESTVMNGKKLLGPLIAEEVAGFLSKQNKEQQFPLFTAIHKICQNEEPPEAIVDALRSHPDLHNLTISNLMSKELSEIDTTSKRSKPKIEFLEDTTYVPLNQIFFDTNKQEQEFEPHIQQTENEEMPLIVAETTTKNEMKAPEPKKFSWREHVLLAEKTNETAKSLHFDKQKGKSSKVVVVYEEDTDNNETDKNDWMADDEWRPQDFTTKPNTMPAEKRPEEKNSLSDADYEPKGDLFDGSQSEFFREPKQQTFPNYQPVDLGLSMGRHNEPLQCDNQVDSNVTAELDKTGNDNKYFAFGYKDHTEITKTNDLESIESLTDAVQALDEIDKIEMVSKEPEEFAPVITKASEQPSDLPKEGLRPTADWDNVEMVSKESDEYSPVFIKSSDQPSDLPKERFRPTGDFDEIEIVSKESDEYSPVFSEGSEVPSGLPKDRLPHTGDFDKIEMFSKEPQEYLPMIIKSTEQPSDLPKERLRHTGDFDEIEIGSKEPDEFSPMFSEGFEQPSDLPKDRLRHTGDFDSLPLTMQKNYGDNFDANKADQRDLKGKSELITSAEAADMLDNPSEFEENAEKARSSFNEDSKLLFESKAIALNLNRLTPQYLKSTDHSQEEVNEFEITSLDKDKDKARNDRERDREAGYWYVDDDMEDDQKPFIEPTESSHKKGGSLISYFERNDNQPDYLTEPTKYAETEWDWLRLSSKVEKQQDATNALHSDDKTKNSSDIKQKKTQIIEKSMDNFGWSEVNKPSRNPIVDVWKNKADKLLQSQMKESFDSVKEKESAQRETTEKSIQEPVAVTGGTPFDWKAAYKQSNHESRHLINEVWKNKDNKLLESQIQEPVAEKADKPTRFEATQKSIQQLFAVKGDQTEATDKSKKAETPAPKKGAGSSKKPSDVDYFDAEASQEAESSLEPEMPLQRLQFDLDAIWERTQGDLDLADYKSEKVGLESVNAETKPNPAILTSVEEMLSKKKTNFQSSQDKKITEKTKTTNTTGTDLLQTKKSPVDSKTSDITPYISSASKTSESSPSLTTKPTDVEASANENDREDKKPKTKIAKKFTELMKGKKQRREVKEMVSDVGYKGESPYHGEPYNLQTYDVKQAKSDLYLTNHINRRKLTKKPPFNPPFNPKVKIPRPPFDGREHEYHTFAFREPRQLVSPMSVGRRSASLNCISKPFNTAPPAKQLKSFLSILKLTRATKILCALQFGVIAALLSKLGED